VPEKDDVTAQVPEQMAEKLHDSFAVDVLPVATEVQTDPMPHAGDRDCRDDRDLVPAVPMPQNWSATDGSPGFSHVWDEQKATLIEEDEVSAPPPGVFLYAAKPCASNARWLSRLA